MSDIKQPHAVKTSQGFFLRQQHYCKCLCPSPALWSEQAGFEGHLFALRYHLLWCVSKILPSMPLQGWFYALVAIASHVERIGHLAFNSQLNGNGLLHPWDNGSTGQSKALHHFFWIRTPNLSLSRRSTWAKSMSNFSLWTRCTCNSIREQACKKGHKLARG